MKKFFSNLLDWIYKKKCYFCGSSTECIKMCKSCYAEMESLSDSTGFEIFGKKVFFCGAYENNIQKLIRGLKYHNQKDLAYYQAKFMFDFWTKLKFPNELFQVVPVPLFKDREKKRKYNHMFLVAEEFCKLTGYELNTNLIKRIKNTKPQYKLNKVQRMENLANAFKTDQAYNNGSKILIIDDICTTGSTFENMIIELQNNSINDIVCLATASPQSK